jgi:hypothetical protein
MSSIEKDINYISSRKDDTMLDVIVRLGKWRGMGIGLFYFIVSLLVFSYGVYSLVSYKETTGIVQESHVDPRVFQSFFGVSYNSYQTTIVFPISDKTFQTKIVSTNIQYPTDTQLNIIYDTYNYDIQITNNTYSWIAAILGFLGLMGSAIYFYLSKKSRTFQTTIGLYGQLF